MWNTGFSSFLNYSTYLLDQ